MNRTERTELELEYYKKKCLEYEIALEMLAIKQKDEAVKRLSQRLKEKESNSAFSLITSHNKMLESIVKEIDSVLKYKSKRDVGDLVPEFRAIRNNISMLLKRY